jgi:hypothetical protein
MQVPCGIMMSGSDRENILPRSGHLRFIFSFVLPNVSVCARHQSLLLPLRAYVVGFNGKAV